MSDIDDMKLLAKDIANGLRKLGPNRAVALSVHVSKELLTDLETKANTLVDLLEASS